MSADPTPPADAVAGLTAIDRQHCRGETTLKPQQRDLNLAVIGNCSINALIDRRGSIVWSCLPKFDGDPVFCALLKKQPDDPLLEQGIFGISIDNFCRAEQEYIKNTAVVKTTLYDECGGGVIITDFCPRFKHLGRTFRPVQIVRILTPFGPEEGDDNMTRVRVTCRPLSDYGANKPQRTRGSNHIRYIGDNNTLRLTTNCPVSYVYDEIPFVLEKECYLILGPDESISDTPKIIAQRFLEQTKDYWRSYVQHLSIPFEWQSTVIRAAITLKMCFYEETGAVIAAITTSIPEHADSDRCWDYRYCWLRDSYFVIHALNRLGDTETMSRYISYITNLVVSSNDGYLQPLYGITLEKKIDERLVDTLDGYRGMGVVRVGNAAYVQVQNDVYGSVILAVTHAFFDERMPNPGTPGLFRKLERLGEQALLRYDKPDAGIWEFRGFEKVHTFSATMCWAAVDRLARIAKKLELPDRYQYWDQARTKIHAEIMEKSFNSELNTFVDCFGGVDVDACLLLLAELGFINATDPKFIGTVAAIEKDLRHGDHVYRYKFKDDFGFAKTAFNICTFWYTAALKQSGNREESLKIFTNMVNSRSHLGLLSEDLDVKNNELWGNFPQTYSMVGMINSAILLSRPWEGAY